MSKLRTDDLQTAREILGYLNFSEGRPDTGFLLGLNSLLRHIPWATFAETMNEHLTELATTVPAFHDNLQARSAISLAFDHVLPAYRSHHRDLLHHLSDTDFENPFFLGRIFEAISKTPFCDRTATFG